MVEVYGFRMDLDPRARSLIHLTIKVPLIRDLGGDVPLSVTGGKGAAGEVLTRLNAIRRTSYKTSAPAQRSSDGGADQPSRVLERSHGQRSDKCKSGIPLTGTMSSRLASIERKHYWPPDHSLGPKWPTTPCSRKMPNSYHFSPNGLHTTSRGCLSWIL